MHYTSKSVYEAVTQASQDTILERKTCELSGTKFPITQKDLEFYDKVSPVFIGKKYEIPTPRLCPEERQRRRLMFRNERRLYKRKCDATGESIISNYSPNTSVNVFAVQYWRSKQWNAPIIQYDRKKNILDHMKTLIWNSPAMSLTNDYTTLENSEYSNYLKNAKDCYLVFGGIDCDSCMYSSTCYQSQDCVDCMKSYDCSFCFDCIACFNCSNMQHSTECYDCSNSSYLDQCSNCHNCFNCSNLSDKRYCIANEQYGVEEYYLMLKEHTDGVIGKYMPAVRSTQCESVFGSGLKNCSRCAFCYDCNDIENGKYLYGVVATNDSMDVTIWGSNNALIYESLEIGEGNYDLLFSITCRNNCYDLIYCQLCESCKDCFGCIGLSNAQYCIFNKQYTKEEYETLVPQIIKQMQDEGTQGEFFDPSLSPFGYNETVAQEYFPLSREEALARGYKRQDKNYDPVVPEGVEVLQGDQVPIDPNSVNESILKKIFVCEVSGRPYRIIRQELVFYQKHNLPLPRKHPDVRNEERMGRRPGRTLYLRTCDKTGEKMISVYPFDYEGKVYSEKAYQDEVYG